MCNIYKHIVGNYNYSRQTHMNNTLLELKTENNLVIKKLYENNFYKISKFVEKNSGNMADAEDLFQDSMLVLIEKIRKEQFLLTASIDTYLYAICKNLWFKKLRDRSIQLPIDDFKITNFQNSIDKSTENKKSYLDILRGYLLKITEHCYGLITDFFLKEKTIEEIQEEYGYTTRHSAQNQKYKCIKQIRKLKELEKN